MIDIKIKVQDNMCSITARDHATGSPEVCSAVSTLMYTLAGWMINNEEHIRNPISILESGYSFIMFGYDDISKAVFDSIVIGLLQVEKVNDGFIRISL